MLPKNERRLGEILVDSGVITQEQLEQALVVQKRNGQRIGSILVHLGFISTQNYLEALANQLDVPYVELSDYEIDAEALKLVPGVLAQKYHVIPLFRIKNALTLAMVDPQDIEAIDEIRRISHLEIEPAIASESDIMAALEHHYGVVLEMSDTLDEVIQSIEAEAGSDLPEEPEENLRQLAEDAPVVKLVNMILAQAIKDRASDIHIEPEEESIRVRYRVDGILQEVFAPPKSLQAAIISRIKILSEMDIAETRIPQDGRFRVHIQGNDVDVRVSTLPTAYGENVVMRILDKNNVLLKLDDLGFSDDNLGIVREMLSNSYGIILVTGPTGSGKTTSLYAFLNTINSVDKNIITLEDPIEYRLKMIRQSQINPKVGMTFASGLRSILRQDPDIIMVGEIRDPETAQIAIESALTGHLVLSTLHTNDAPGALTRLSEMGVEPFLLSSAIIGVIAQRLVRRVCPKCREAYSPTPLALKRIGINPERKAIQFYKGKGCPVCKHSGYKGRIGIYEILKVDDKIRELILSGATSDDIRKEAIRRGMKTLKHDGLLKALKGMTTVEEVMRVINIS
ncbi:MAG: type II secretion system ATPase GspE [Calditrichaeota bacterium]|nr:type II secretion system ATPase GspE [Calditrichota bacterium]